MAQQTRPTTGYSGARLPHASPIARPRPTTLAALRGDEAELYTRHHHALRRVVGRRVNISPDLVEDACQQAWTKLLCHQPDRGPALFGWLVTVAVREAYRHSDKEGRQLSIDTPMATGRDRTSAIADQLTSPANIDDTLEARRALRALAALPPRLRRHAVLQVAGVSYREITVAENATYRSVNKQLDKARRQLRHAAKQAA